VAKLAETLRNVVLNKRVDFDAFNHIDFITAIDIRPLIINPLIQILSQH
jgi:hypothetical protein